MKKIAFWSNKGGVGQTTIAFNTIYQYAIKNPDKKVLVIDTNPNAYLTDFLFNDYEQEIHPVDYYEESENRKGLCNYLRFRFETPFIKDKNIINISKYVTKISDSRYTSESEKFPDNIYLIGANACLEPLSRYALRFAHMVFDQIDAMNCVYDWIKDLVDSANGEYDVLFMDTPSSLNLLSLMAFRCSNGVIITTTDDYLGMQNLDKSIALTEYFSEASDVDIKAFHKNEYYADYDREDFNYICFIINKSKIENENFFKVYFSKYGKGGVLSPKEGKLSNADLVFVREVPISNIWETKTFYDMAIKIDNQEFIDEENGAALDNYRCATEDIDQIIACIERCKTV